MGTGRCTHRWGQVAARKSPLIIDRSPSWCERSPRSGPSARLMEMPTAVVGSIKTDQ